MCISHACHISYFCCVKVGRRAADCSYLHLLVSWTRSSSFLCYPWRDRWSTRQCQIAMNSGECLLNWMVSQTILHSCWFLFSTAGGWSCERRGELHLEKPWSWSLVCSLMGSNQWHLVMSCIKQELRTIDVLAIYETIWQSLIIKVFCCRRLQVTLHWGMLNFEYGSWATSQLQWMLNWFLLGKMLMRHGFCANARPVCTGHHGSGRCMPMFEPLCRTVGLLFSLESLPVNMQLIFDLANGHSSSQDEHDEPNEPFFSAV